MAHRIIFGAIVHTLWFAPTVLDAQQVANPTAAALAEFTKHATAYDEVPNFKPQVNGIYPINAPKATFPPRLSLALPTLPDELEFRLVGTGLRRARHRRTSPGASRISRCRPGSYTQSRLRGAERRGEQVGDEGVLKQRRAGPGARGPAPFRWFTREDAFMPDYRACQSVT